MRVGKDLFPFHAVTEENAYYEGPYFEAEAYIGFNDSQKTIDEKIEYVKSKKGHLFRLRHAINYYCSLDVQVRSILYFKNPQKLLLLLQILTWALMAFYMQVLELQEVIKEVYKVVPQKDRLGFLLPFNSPLCSIGSLVYGSNLFY